MYMCKNVYLFVYSRNYILCFYAQVLRNLLCPCWRKIPCIFQRELLNKHLNIATGKHFHTRDKEINLTGLL